MPYIKNENRKRIINGGNPETSGELNYLLTTIIDSYLNNKGLNYANLNEVLGVLECAKFELYRRLAVKYEDKKIIENGDVYTN